MPPPTLRSQPRLSVAGTPAPLTEREQSEFNRYFRLSPAWVSVAVCHAVTLSLYMYYVRNNQCSGDSDQDDLASCSLSQSRTVRGSRPSSALSVGSTCKFS